MFFIFSNFIFIFLPVPLRCRDDDGHRLYCTPRRQRSGSGSDGTKKEKKEEEILTSECQNVMKIVLISYYRLVGALNTNLMAEILKREGPVVLAI